ncbi:MAG: DNA repair protein RecN, partial [Desulfocucumaceae bacterium]
MLINLFIKDFGIIEKAQIDFSDGLNVLTGETGSGKSIIIDAIQVVSGGRASSEYIRSGCDRAVIQMSFDIKDLPHIHAMLSEWCIDDDKGSILVLARELNRNGRSICRVNGQVTTLNTYKEIGQKLIDIQGQYDQQMIFDTDRQLFLLDAYGGDAISKVSREFLQIYRQSQNKRKLLNDLGEKQREWTRKQDIINYQINDINTVSPMPGEDEELRAERKKLANLEKITALVGESYRTLYGGGDQASLLESAGKSIKNLDRALELDPALARVKDLAESGIILIEEACSELSHYIDALEFYPSRLEYLEERIDQLSKLKKKYGHTLEEVISFRDEIENELLQMQESDKNIGDVQRDLEVLVNKLTESASILTKNRNSAAKALESDISAELEQLEMTGALFKIEFTPLVEITETGKERAEFLISANPGEPVRPLSKIVSGGEASRIFLAIKGILAGIEDIPTLIFDEVDTGIGGTTIRSVARKLKKLAGARQVLCVTHSASVASFADRHLSIV